MDQQIEVLEIDLSELYLECGQCRCKFPVDQAIQVLSETFVCSDCCLWEWNNEGFVRSEFYD
jgi:hypothetical protein